MRLNELQINYERRKPMFISKKKFNALEKRIADLEMQVQSQQKMEIKIDGKMLYSVVGKSTLSIDAKQITAQAQ